MLGRGLASTVRRAIEKGSGQQFAVKIVDISTDKQSEVVFLLFSFNYYFRKMLKDS